MFNNEKFIELNLKNSEPLSQNDLYEALPTSLSEMIPQEKFIDLFESLNCDPDAFKTSFIIKMLMNELLSIDLNISEISCFQIENNSARITEFSYDNFVKYILLLPKQDILMLFNSINKIIVRFHSQQFQKKIKCFNEDNIKYLLFERMKLSELATKFKVIKILQNDDIYSVEMNQIINDLEQLTCETFSTTLINTNQLVSAN